MSQTWIMKQDCLKTKKRALAWHTGRSGPDSLYCQKGRSSLESSSSTLSSIAAFTPCHSKLEGHIPPKQAPYPKLCSMLVTSQSLILLAHLSLQTHLPIKLRCLHPTRELDPYGPHRKHTGPFKPHQLIKRHLC